MNYHVKVDNFEGPMDLLLFFTQRDQLNIYDIPITYIVRDFLKYMNIIEKMNIELGGEFVYMASLLMKIKVKMLFPTSDDENVETEDPRVPLVQRLLEYQKFKVVGQELSGKYNEYSTRNSRGHNILYEKSCA